MTQDRQATPYVFTQEKNAPTFHSSNQGELETDMRRKDNVSASY